jgi:ankyrin repeat protein
MLDRDRGEEHMEDGVAELIGAIRADDAEAVRAVLARHPELREVIDEPLAGYGFDEPPILAAVHKQNRAMVDALLDFGANVNERSRWWAGSFGVLDFASAELSEHLIARGAALDLHSAARLGKLERVREFLAADPALVHARGGDGQLPLHFAATVEVAEALLRAGAELEARDLDHESTALMFMVSSRPERHDVARYLLTEGAQADLLAASALGELALVERLLNDDPEAIRMTVSDRYFPKMNPRAGGVIYLYGFGPTTTPHMLAARYGHTAVFDLLMQRSGPSQRMVTAAELGDAAQVAAIVARHPGVVEKLNMLAQRRIIGPALRNNTRAVELLLDHGWPAEAALENGQTALHYACWHGNAALVGALLAHGASVDAMETEHGGTPLAWAMHGSAHSWHRAKGDYPAAIRALRAAGARLSDGQMAREATAEALEALREPLNQA